MLKYAEDKISEAYRRLGHSKGWSFLYTPGATLTELSPFLFMGLNPGGDGEYGATSLTTEAGNAYHPDVEKDWLRNGQPAPLQLQVVAFYELLGKRLGHPARKLMDATLAANFCPFRSTDWASLERKTETIDFCVELWSKLLSGSCVTTALCMSSIVYDNLVSIFCKNDGRVLETRIGHTGWGKVTYRSTQIAHAKGKILILYLPHLSRYKIFSSDKCRGAVNDIVESLASSLSNWKP